MIIDAHTHFFDPARPQGVPWPPADAGRLYRTVLPADYRALAEPEGVSGTVVIEASPWIEDNQWVLNLAREDPLIVAVIGHLKAGTPAFQEQLARFVGDPLFRGIRCRGGDFDGGASDAFLADMQRLAAHDLALDVLARPLDVEALLALAQAAHCARRGAPHFGLPGTIDPIEGWIATVPGQS